MQCPSCGAENPDAHRFCDACGEPLVHCEQCGAMGRPGARFCGQCGAHLGFAAGGSDGRGGAAADVAPEIDLAAKEAELAERSAQEQHWPDAMEHAARAGAAASARGDFRDATEHYRGALEAAAHLDPAPPGMLIAIHNEYGLALHACGDYERAAGHHEQALAIARETDRRGDAIDALLGLADASFELHRPEPAEQCGEEALALAADLDDPARQAAALIRRARCIAAWRGPIAEARSAAKGALERTDSVDDAGLRSQAVVVLGAVLEWRADFDGCLPYLHEGSHLSERLGDQRLHATALCHLGHAYRGKGRYEQALRWFTELCRYADAAGDGFWQARVPHGVAAVHLELHDLDTAVGVAQEGEELAQRLSRWPEPRAHCLVTLADAYLAGEAYDAAEQQLRRAEALLDHDAWGRWRWHVPLLRARGALALAGGHRADAWRHASEALELATQVDARQDVAYAKLLLGDIAAADDRVPEALQLLRSAVSLAEHIGAARPLWLASRSLGLLAARLGHDRDAESHLTQAAQIIEAIAIELVDPALRTAFTRARPVGDVYRGLGHRPLP